MWCLHYIDFKGNYTKDCPTSGRDFKWTVQGKKQKDKFVLASLQRFFVSHSTSPQTSAEQSWACHSHCVRISSQGRAIVAR